VVAALTSVAFTFGLWFCWDTGGRGFTVPPLGPVGGLEDPMGNNNLHLQQPFLARCCRRSLSASSSSSSSATVGAADGGSCGGGGGNGGKCLDGDINPPPFPYSSSTQTPKGSTAWCVGGMDRVPVEGGREEVAPLAGLILLPPLAQETIERGVIERAAGVSAHEDGEVSLR